MGAAPGMAPAPPAPPMQPPESQGLEGMGPGALESAQNLKTIVDQLRQFEMNNPAAHPVIQEMLTNVRQLQMVLVQTQPVAEPPAPPIGG